MTPELRPLTEPRLRRLYREQVAEDLRTILADHGLSGGQVRVTKSERSLAITDVFPDLFEGKRSVNVKI